MSLLDTNSGTKWANDIQGALADPISFANQPKTSNFRPQTSNNSAKHAVIVNQP